LILYGWWFDLICHSISLYGWPSMCSWHCFSSVSGPSIERPLCCSNILLYDNWFVWCFVSLLFRFSVYTLIVCDGGIFFCSDRMVDDEFVNVSVPLSAFYTWSFLFCIYIISNYLLIFIYDSLYFYVVITVSYWWIYHLPSIKITTITIPISFITILFFS